MNNNIYRPNRHIEETEVEQKPKGYLLLKALGITALAAVVITSAISLNHMNHGSDNPDKFGKLDKTIEDVVLDDGARLRYDPNTGDNGSNLIETLDIDQSITIKTPEGAYVDENEMSANGPYYGIKAEDLKKAMPGFDAQGDNDGVIWINTQKATPEHQDKK